MKRILLTIMALAMTTVALQAKPLVVYKRGTFVQGWFERNGERH